MLSRTALGLVLLAAIAMAAGCTTSGTLDYIPKRPVVEVTHTTYDGPSPGGAGRGEGSCPAREASGTCPIERVTCAFDDRGCEVCICASP